MRDDEATGTPKTGEPITFINFARSVGRFAKPLDKDGNVSRVVANASRPLVAGLR